ncbi:MAG: hypothetical protein WC243_01240 [Patescibacteria group bacterium]|jgi:hypothetical protein
MNNSYQAKSGFKTFALVFMVSLGVFFLFYYLTSSASKEVDIESYSAPREDVLGESTEKSAFEELSEQKMEPSKVLAGATTRETTQSTVPVTGTTEITFALFSGMTILTLGAYTLWTNPRKKALATFEKNATRD